MRHELKMKYFVGNGYWLLSSYYQMQCGLKSLTDDKDPCSAPFTAITRGRHLCRFGSGKGILKGFVIPAMIGLVQSAKHDVMDWTCARG
ncbi:hypothetical protein TSUD_57290 [Trifolium subterraneum]|uniref:Uncharacterized protein n=1 Tax=Trifolium subterraneum TaxID=3900 RepID=A0A2Z6NG63_TRISU|nr:hypothetical protein TSUD_57290 [Trifolium subterraneum]